MTVNLELLYKDSGVDWLGEIPATWQVKPFWTLFRREKSTGHPDEELLSVYRDYGVIPKSSRDDNGNVESEDLNSYQLVEPNDLVMNKMKAWQGSIAVSDIRGIVSPAYFVFKPRHEAHGPFLHHLLRSKKYIGEYNRLSKGIRVGQWDLEPTAFRTTPIVLPPLEEQVAIADFLERETAQIDALIEKQKLLIGTVAERRQSVISNAVTKGIDANVPVKYSGLPWLGNIPENWSLKPLKSIATLNPEVLSENTDEELPIRYIEISNVSLINGVEGWTETKFGAAPSRARRVVRPRDVLISTVRTYLRAIGMVKEVSELGFDVASTGFAVLRAKSVNSDFLELAITAEYFVSGIEAASVGVSYPGINSSQIMSMRIPVPPLDIQEQISVHVRSLIAELDILKDKTEKMIDVLKERRQALISAAVTGKIDVRGK